MTSTTPASLRVLAETDVREEIPPSALRAALSSAPFIHIEGSFNARALGALPGSAFRPNLAFRSGALAGLTPAGAGALRDLGVTRVFDVRSRAEHARQPDPEVPGAEGVWAPTDEEEAAVDVAAFVDGVGERGYEAMYLDVLRVYQPALREILAHVRDRPGEPFLFHCTAGRDRTGVVAGLLLTLAGDDEELVALDFLLSRVGTEPAREQLVAFARHGAGVSSDDAPGFYNLCSLRREFWEAFAQGVEREYGGFEKYVVDVLGFSKEDLSVIKRNLRKEG
jgi:protein tyrosine/serine phosphatase